MELLSRGAFRTAVRWEMVRSARYSSYFSVFSLCFGALGAAEAWIEEAALVCADCLREGDLLGRLAGARLGGLLLNADNWVAPVIADRVRHRLIDHTANSGLGARLRATGGPALRITSFPSVAPDEATMLRQLDIDQWWEPDDNDGPGLAGVGARI